MDDKTLCRFCGRQFGDHNDPPTQQICKDGCLGSKFNFQPVVNPWRRDNPPDARTVLALYKRRPASQLPPMVIVAIFGSESKWVALDHDLRRTYLDEGTVLGWRELPEIP